MMVTGVAFKTAVAANRPGRAGLNCCKGALGAVTATLFVSTLLASEPSTDLPIEIVAIRDNGRSVVNGKVIGRGTIQVESRSEKSGTETVKSVECSGR